MKKQRGLSGIYFRAKNEETGGMDNIAFEDLSEEKQDDILSSGRSEEWLKSFIKQLANTINRLGEEFDIIIK